MRAAADERGDPGRKVADPHFGREDIERDVELRGDASRRVAVEEERCERDASHCEPGERQRPTARR
jgi:hypothetical protein